MENKREGLRASSRAHLRQGTGAATKENNGRSVRAAFGDLTNHDAARHSSHGVSQKAEPSGLKGLQQENIPQGKQQDKISTRRSALGPLNGISQQNCVGTATEEGGRAIATLTNIEAPLSTSQPLWVDIDKADGRNHLSCSHIANDIMNNLFRAERSKRPDPSYMETLQPDVMPPMRAILVDWLVEVSQEYKLHSETLFQTVGLVDRYLSVTPVTRNHLQLVGVSCMLLASKYEEIYSPQVEEFCFITENTYTKDQVVNTEWKVLITLNFELTVPTVRAFLRRFVKAAAATYPGGLVDPRLESLSCYLAELTLLEYEALKYQPSMIAASAVFLAQFCLCRATWNPTLQHYSSYTAPDLRPCVMMLHKCYLQARGSELPAVRDKYNHTKYFCVASSNPPAFLPASIFFAQAIP